MTARRLLDAPIVHAGLLPGREGDNINGPSLINAPDWLPGRLGRFYLYFAHHNGRHVRLAYADQLTGPWTVHLPGTLHLHEATGCVDHIASPDVHIDEAKREIVMFFHGVVRGRRDQKTFLARSKDGIRFRAETEEIADFYFRTVRWGDRWIGMSKGGVAYLSDRPHGNFRRLPARIFPMGDPRGNAPGDVRHVALRVVADRLDVFYTCIGDAPEQIYLSVVDLTAPVETWVAVAARRERVLAPERPWEGARLPVRPSIAGPARGPENALRDPALFSWNGATYLLYSAAGEGSIAIAEIEP